MRCVVCNTETNLRMKNVPVCSRECREKVYETRDEMKDEFEQLKEEANGLNKNPEVIRKYQEAPFGTIRNALIKCEIKRNDEIENSKQENTNE